MRVLSIAIFGVFISLEAFAAQGTPVRDYASQVVEARRQYHEAYRQYNATLKQYNDMHIRQALLYEQQLRAANNALTAYANANRAANEENWRAWQPYLKAMDENSKASLAEHQKQTSTVQSAASGATTSTTFIKKFISKPKPDSDNVNVSVKP